MWGIRIGESLYPIIVMTKWFRVVQLRQIHNKLKQMHRLMFSDITSAEEICFEIFVLINQLQRVALLLFNVATSKNNEVKKQTS
jgi:hypothetical protein